MTSEQLANEVARMTREAQDRIMGTGRNRYEGGYNEQRFEKKLPSQLIDEIHAELVDIINYAVMTDIQVQELKHQLMVLEAAQTVRFG